MTVITETVNNLVGATGTLHLRSGKPEAIKQSTPQPGPDYPYARFLSHFDQALKLPPLEHFEHVDPGHAALKDADPQSFLGGAQVNHLTPKFGSEVEGIQLSKLDAHEKRYIGIGATLTMLVSWPCTWRSAE